MNFKSVSGWKFFELIELVFLNYDELDINTLLFMFEIEIH